MWSMATAVHTMGSVTERSYHHGNLRAELLSAAERTLRDEGADRISLRDLARQAGVSHAAPSRHFPDRRALLCALAADGFARLGHAVGAAIDNADTSIYAQLRAALDAFVRFAADNGALLDLMFTVGKTEQTAEMREASGPLYAAFADLVQRGQQDGVLRPGPPERLRLLIMATVQGIAFFATSGAVSEEQVNALLDDACSLFTVAAV
jgi:AcrR family transcriptional regulator